MLDETNAKKNNERKKLNKKNEKNAEMYLEIHYEIVILIKHG